MTPRPLVPLAKLPAVVLARSLAAALALASLGPGAVAGQDRASRLDEVFHGIAYRPVPGDVSATGRGAWTPSPHDPDVGYRTVDGRVHRSGDGGSSWSEISPVLARDGLTAVAESPVEPGLVWAGGGDGSLHLTRDGGLSWDTLLGPDPAGSSVRQVVASAHDGGIAYMVVEALPVAGAPPAPLLFRVEGYGAETHRVAGAGDGFPEDQPVTAFAEDPGNPDLLFAGTPAGVWVSFNGAAAWDRLRLGMPEAFVTDLRVSGPDLIVDTRERGRFVLDEIAPLRHVVRGLMAGEPYLFEPAPVYLPSDAPAGGARPVAYLDYLLPSFVGNVRLEVLEAEGRALATFEVGGRDAEGRRLPGSRAGVHRIAWDLSRRGETGEARLVEPGAYTLRMTVDGLVRERLLEVVPAPS